MRVDSNELPIRNRPIKAGNDQADYFILFSSGDGAKTFDRIGDFGDYGETRRRYRCWRRLLRRYGTSSGWKGKQESSGLPEFLPNRW